MVVSTSLALRSIHVRNPCGSFLRETQVELESLNLKARRKTTWTTTNAKTTLALPSSTTDSSHWLLFLTASRPETQPLPT